MTDPGAGVINGSVMNPMNGSVDRNNGSVDLSVYFTEDMLFGTPQVKLNYFFTGKLLDLKTVGGIKKVIIPSGIKHVYIAL